MCEKEFIDDFYQTQRSVPEILGPYLLKETALRKRFATDRQFLGSNLISIFQQEPFPFYARQFQFQSSTEYIFPLKSQPENEAAIVSSSELFMLQFGYFSRNCLSELNWENVVVAGGATTRSLLPVPRSYSGNLSQYYEKMIPITSDIDIFLYGLSEEAAREKIREICTNIAMAVRGNIMYDLHPFTVERLY